MRRWRSGAHKHIACVDDEHHCSHDEKAGVACDDRDATVFTGGGVVEKAEPKALKCRQISRAAGDAKAKADGKITKPDGEAVTQSPQEMIFRHRSDVPLLLIVHARSAQRSLYDRKRQK